MTVEATHAPPQQALTPETVKALNALLAARSGGQDDPQLAADFAHEVWHDVSEGRYSEGEAKALLLAYDAPYPDDRGEEKGEEKAKPKATPKPEAKANHEPAHHEPAKKKD